MQVRTFCRLAAMAAGVALFSSSAFAAEPWDVPAFSADPKGLIAAAEKVPAADASFVVLLREAKYTFQADGKSHTTLRHMMRVVSEAAIDGLGTIEVPWAPWYQDRPVIAARIVARDGAVHTLDPKELTEAPAREDLDIFSDNRVLR
jgi:hypothetical protein